MCIMCKSFFPFIDKNQSKKDCFLTDFRTNDYEVTVKSCIYIGILHIKSLVLKVGYTYHWEINKNNILWKMNVS